MSEEKFNAVIANQSGTMETDTNSNGRNPKSRSYDVSSVLLIVFVGITFITNVSIAVTQSLVDKWYSKTTMVVILISLQMIRNVSYILPALAIKNKTLKIIAVIITSIMVLYLVISPIFKLS